MRFSELAVYLEELEATSSRNRMTEILADVLRRADAREIDKLCYLLLGELLPAYRGLEFQIAEKMMIAILAVSYGRTPENIQKQFKAVGDLGDVAYALASGRRGAKNEKKLTVVQVYDALHEIASVSGEGSQERKIHKAAELLTSLDTRSVKYVVRIPVGKLRLGFSDATLLDAFSEITAGDKSGRAAIERAYNCLADIGAIATRIKKGGIRALAGVKARPGIPIRPSLAERLLIMDDVIEKAGPSVGVEAKLDGFRTQIHVWRERGSVRVALFSRNLENTTAMFPEIAEAASVLPVKSVILDAEAIGYHSDTGTFAVFQETVQRKRKHDVAAFREKIPLAAFVFDVMHYDGASLIATPFHERRKILERIMGRAHQDIKTGVLRTSEQVITDSFEIVREELWRNVERGLEGVVVKNLAAVYEAGNRGFHWIKLKARSSALGDLRAAGADRGVVSAHSGSGKVATHIAHQSLRLPDTVDCVVMAAYRGRGKRAQFGVGGFLLGVRGEDGKYYSISRLGTGLSDEQFREARRRMALHEVRTMPKEYVVDESEAPDSWIVPSLVVEILADEITRSPRHTARRPGDDKGFSLRFPRLVRFRDDKKPEDATSIEEVARMEGLQNKG